MVSSNLQTSTKVTQELTSWFWINKFSVSSGTSSDWGYCHGVLVEDCSMQQDRRPQMPEGQWLQCSSLEWTDLQMRQNGDVIGRRSSWSEYSNSTSAREWQGRESIAKIVKNLHRNKELGAGLNEWRGGAGIRERENSRYRRYLGVLMIVSWRFL